MKNFALLVFIFLVFHSFLSFVSFAADDDNKAQTVDMQALAKRFDAEAKPFFTVDKSTAFVKLGGGFTYLPENSLVPVLDDIVKVNGFFCNRAKSRLAEASSFIKPYESSIAELEALKKKIADAKKNIDSLEREFKYLSRFSHDNKKNIALNSEMAKKQNELTDARRDLKKLEKDFDKKNKDMPDALKKADAVKTALDTFLENQEKLAADK